MFEKKLEFEIKKAKIVSFFINLAFLLPASLCVDYLFLYFREIRSPLALVLSRVEWHLGISIVAALVWTSCKFSVGRAWTDNTNPVLKPTRGHLNFGDWVRTFSGKFSIFVALAILLAGACITEMSAFSLFSNDGMFAAKRIMIALFSPDMDILSSVIESTIVTIFIALIATLLAIPVAFVLSFFAARNLVQGSWVGSIFYVFFRFSANLMRSIEPLIWAIIFSVWVGIGPFAGMLALMIHSIASLIKLYSEQIEGVDRGPIEAIETVGANKIQVIWYAVVPQVIPSFLAYTIYRWDINIRMATIIGLVGGGGVGTMLAQYQGLGSWNQVGTIVFVVAAVVWTMDFLSSKIRAAIL